jgi:signal transduction histidine kinase
MAAELLGVDPLDLMERGAAALPALGIAAALDSLREAERQKERINAEWERRRLSITLMKDGLSLFEEPCILILVADATEQHKLEDFQANCQGEFLHRMRGSLTSVKTSLAFLASEASADLPESIREIVLLGHAEVQRLHALVLEMGELLALESHGAETDLYFETVELGAFLARFLRRLRKSPQAQGREILLEAEPAAARSIRVIADYDKLGSVLGHLVANALAYSPTPAPVRISAAVTGIMAEIRVRDEGRGIRAEEIPRIFDKFYRSPEAGGTEGSGLGLFLAKSYAEKMQGALKMESVPGRGTTALLSLPLAAEDGWTE